MADLTIDPNKDNSPQAREARGEIEARTVENRAEEQSWGESILSGSKAAEVGQGNQAATDLGDAIGQMLSQTNDNRSDDDRSDDDRS